MAELGKEAETLAAEDGTLQKDIDRLMQAARAPDRGLPRAHCMLVQELAASRKAEGELGARNSAQAILQL